MVERILAETGRALTEKLGVRREGAGRRITAMRDAFPEASVHGFEILEPGLSCHPKDRHVLAAAIAAGAETLVTANVKDFPEESCVPQGVTVIDPDLFLLELIAQDARACQAAVEREARRMRRPPMTPQDVLTGVAALVPTFANLLHQAMLDDVPGSMMSQLRATFPPTSRSRWKRARCRAMPTPQTSPIRCTWPSPGGPRYSIAIGTSLPSAV